MISNANLDQIRSQIIDLVKQYSNIAYAEKVFIPGITEIPASGKLLSGAEIENMVHASLDGWLTSGRFNAKFEEALKQFLGVKHVLTVNSGSSANLLAFSSLTSAKLGNRAIMPGDEVITVAAGFPTTINPIIQLGAVPVFVDVELSTYNIEVKQLESALSSKTRAVMIAHTLGNPFDIDAIVDFCKKNNLWLIEDCCDALGATYKGRMVGTFGDLATLSFYPAHHITMGEGGAIFTNSSELISIVESYRDWGRDCYCAPGKDNTCGKRYCWKLGGLPVGYDHKYTYSHLGYNLKITDMQAACGLAQIKRVSNFIDARRKNFLRLKEGLLSCKEFIILPKATHDSDPSWFGFPITLKPSCPVSRQDFLEYLNQNKIGTRLLFAGNVTLQPYMAGRNYRQIGSLDNTNIIMNSTFWIGVHPALTDEMLDFVIEKIEVFLGVRF